jgi:hypothetical protein
LKKVICVLATVLILSSLIGPAMAQPPVSVNLSVEMPLPIGQPSTVAVTVKDVVNSTGQLVFVGLRWEWDTRDTFYIGQNSDKGAVLAAGENITYIIGVPVSSNVSQGKHKLSTLVAYRLFTGGNWTDTLDPWWAADIQLALPQAQSQTSTEQSAQQTSDLESMAVLVALVGIGLYLGGAASDAFSGCQEFHSVSKNRVHQRG